LLRNVQVTRPDHVWATNTFCLEALEEALRRARPEMFNSNQGSQFTAASFTGRLQQAGVAIRMDGRGREHPG
jgi:putative transposase